MVERNLAKVEVASSNLVSRSKFENPVLKKTGFFYVRFNHKRKHKGNGISAQLYLCVLILQAVRWEAFMRVHSLFLYPVKSLAGIAVDSFELDEFGPAGDRRWMLIDDECQFVSQRTLPQLVMVQPALGADGEVSIALPGPSPIVLQISGESLSVRVWRDWVQGQVGCDAANAAISHFCGLSLRFVFMPDSSFRQVQTHLATERRRVSFADGYPLLITSVASLQELNERLEITVDMRHFRPNIVVEGAVAWSEDCWRAITIGEGSYRVLKPCSRCVMTTVNPDTGEKAASVQPLRTLASYRRTADGIMFGMNAIHDSPGRLSVGDCVIVNQSE